MASMVKHLLVMSYLCKTGLPAAAVIKSESRAKVNVEQDGSGSDNLSVRQKWPHRHKNPARE